MIDILTKITAEEAKRVSKDYRISLEHIYREIREEAQKNRDHLIYTIVFREDIVDDIIHDLINSGFNAYLSKRHEDNPYGICGYNIIVEWKDNVDNFTSDISVSKMFSENDLILMQSSIDFYIRQWSVNMEKLHNNNEISDYQFDEHKKTVEELNKLQDKITKYRFGDK